ncbi:hypothetical protein NicSoilB4_31630 [Arthrobacter sp. NicSoilB4]|nr:hypothetical protein NicSoilB4_31630 [Arthrobacter sp. NicSoilB4]
MEYVAAGKLGEITVDVGLLVGIVWTLGQIGLVLLLLYVVVRLAVTHSLNAHRRSETEEPTHAGR